MMHAIARESTKMRVLLAVIGSGVDSRFQGRGAKEVLLTRSLPIGAVAQSLDSKRSLDTPGRSGISPPCTQSCGNKVVAFGGRVIL